MKKILTAICLIIIFISLMIYISFSKQNTVPGNNATIKSNISNKKEDMKMIDIKIQIGNKIFPAKFYENETTQALIRDFPLSLSMSDLNNNEKYSHLAKKLPSSLTETPSTINAGEIMCWSENSFVIFYKTFSNTYGGYVRLGYIENVSDFVAELENTNGEITLSVK